MSYVVYIWDRNLYYGGFFSGWVSSKDLAHKFSTKKEAELFVEQKYKNSKDIKIVRC